MAVKINCTFTAPNGTLLTAYPWTDPADVNVPVAAWTTGVGGSAMVISNQANLPSYQWLYLDAGVADCTITAQAKFTGASQPVGFLYRYLDNNNHWYVWFAETYIRISEVSGGSSATRATTAHVYTINTSYTLTLTLAGNVATVTADGASASYTSAVGNTRTKHGLISGNGGYYDDYKIETAGNAVPIPLSAYYKRRIFSD